MRATGVSLAAAVLTLAACTAAPSSPGAGATPHTQASVSPPGSSRPSPPPRHPPSAAAPWPTYHGDNQRSGYADVAPVRPPLRIGWTRRLDGAVYAQPIVVGDVVIAATERNSVYALRRGTGRQIGRIQLGAPIRRPSLRCGNIDPLGITGTPSYDAGTGSVFVVTEGADGRHDVHALDLHTGRQLWQRNLDVIGGRDRRAEQQRGALLVAHGRIYVPFGGLYGDCGNYVGYVAAVSTTGTGPVLRFAVPTGRGAGIWAPPGPVQDKTGTDLFVSSGNGAATAGSYDGSDSVVQLSPTLRRLGFFSPESWADDNAHDLDLGSSAPVPLPTGTFVAAGKRGTVYLLGSGLDGIGGIGGERAHIDGCAAYGGAAFVGQSVLLPCVDGIRLLDTGLDRLDWRWRAPGISGSPVIARDRVYALDVSSGDLVELDLRSGAVVSRVHVGAVTRFATPVPLAGAVLVGTTTGVTCVSGQMATGH
jgi:outer membrane protein assembly factor BamB